MLRSVLRLRAHSRLSFNVLNSASPNNPTRHSSRRPVKILNEPQESPLKFDDEENLSHKKKIKNDVYRQSTIDGNFYIKSEIDGKSKEIKHANKPQRPAWNEDENDFQFSKYMLIVKSRARRRRERITLLEGQRLIGDAILAGVKVKALFVSLRSEFRKLHLPEYNFKLHWMPYKYFQKWSDVKSSSGVMAIAEIPDVNKSAPDPQCLPLTIICDNIRDPGNMGAILRVLAAVGSSKILVTVGCVDIWEPKVLRAGAGGHFRVPIEYDLSWEDIESRFRGDTPSVYLADSGNTEAAAKVPIGNTDEAAEVPSGNTDDAAKVLETNSESDLEEDTAPKTNGCLENDRQLTDNSAASDSIILQLIPYYAVRFNSKGSNILIISNEHFGPSKEALAFASAREGVKIQIPLCGKVESLNVVSALSVIAFEMRRQAVLN